MSIGYEAAGLNNVSPRADINTVTLEEVVKSAEGQIITRVTIEDVIPPDLYKIAPQLRCLTLREISMDQLCG